MLLLMPLLDSLFLDVQCFLLPQSALYLAKGIVWSQFTPGACIQFGSHVPLCSKGRHLCFGRRVPWKDIISTNNTLLEQAERDLMSSHIHPTADHVPAIYKPWGLLHPSELIISLKNYHGGGRENGFLFSHQRWIVWPGWGREENGSKMASDCILQLTAVFSSWDFIWAECASCLLPFFIWDTPNSCCSCGGFAWIPAGSWCSLWGSAGWVEWLLSPLFTLVLWSPCESCTELASLPSPALLALGGVLPLPGV